MRQLSLVALITVCVLSGCVTTQTGGIPQSQQIEAVQVGDQRLTCEELGSEMARMDAHVRESERVEADRQRGQASDTVTSTAAGSVVPFGGLIHLMAVNQPRNAEWINARERGGQAARRKEHLTALFNQKNCPPSSAPARL